LSKGERKRGGIFPILGLLGTIAVGTIHSKDSNKLDFLFGQQRKIKGQLFFKKKKKSERL
jgi:hypothetical protein